DRRLREALDVRPVRTGPESHASVWDSLAAGADSIDLVVLSAYTAPPGGEGAPDVAPRIERFLAAAEARGAEVALISFGSPYLLADLPEATTYLVAWHGGDAAQRAAADALLGRTGIDGRLPVSLPPFHAAGAGLVREAGSRPERTAAGPAPGEVAPNAVGMDPAALARIDRILEDAVARGVTPGAALAVGRRGRLVRSRGYGWLDRDPASPAVTDSTIYDLASLTKVVGTTTAVMRLVDEGRLALDTPIGDVLPEWSTGWKAAVTVEQLLRHRGGLPPFEPFWREIEGREAYRAAIAALEPDYAPGTATVYSDLGFMTLGFVVEALTDRPLDAWLEENIFEPLGMADTGFRPPPSALERVAPTEIDTVFRGRHVRGEVHDENAFALGGVAGHAGLFSSARDLARFAAWLAGAARAGRAEGAGRPALAPDSAAAGRGNAVQAASLPDPATVARFTARADSTSSRALGWDTPSGRSSAGRFFTEHAFGHTGFTGTSLWIDPELDLFVVLLTNRVNPTRAERRHIALRRAVHDAAALAIRDRPVEPRR
ncbi:MAG: serine hydrolase domain-containing protein, partial [Gemmatimonadota bacterium]|nr:serine hydrolase domain-containing protein [Gemmatimonadota bacterium]